MTSITGRSGRMMPSSGRSCASSRSERRRFGYRRPYILLRREGIVISRKKTQQLYGEEKLASDSTGPIGNFSCQDRFRLA